MTDNIYLQKMFYSFAEAAWHKLGIVSQVPMTAKEALDGPLQGGHEVELRPASLVLNGEMQETGRYGIVRCASKANPKEALFGFCSDHYHPLQPAEICESFDQNVGKHIETLGFLGNGEDMFLSTKLPTIQVLANDSISMYMIIRCGFDGMHGPRLFTAGTRPVCQNTANFAEAWAEKNADGKGRGMVWKGKGTNEHLLEHLGYWLAHVMKHAQEEHDLLANFFGTLAKTPIKNDTQVHEILWEAYPSNADVSAYFPDQLKPAKQEKINSANKSREDIRDGIYSLFAGQGTAITPDYWGLFNATTEYFCHYQPSKKPIAESIMFGGRQADTMSMVYALKDRVE